MSDEASPRPWKYGETVDRGCLILDATGRCLANTQYGINNDMATNRANAQLVCDAVNEHEELAAECDRLRKEVGRFRSAVKLLDAAAGPYCAPELRPVLIAEARAALGEDTK